MPKKKAEKKSAKTKSFFGEEFHLPEVEEKVLKFWEESQIFERSLELRKTKSGKNTFVFYEGPPYANGKPGIHHVLARVVKDIILRFKSMRGFYVPRRAGWDTHGLPVEIAAEKALGLKSKKEIEKYGIELFNQKAKEAVWLYKDEWEHMTKRIGYWLDLKNAYVTYTSEYVETLWWTLKKIWERKLLYRGHKVVPWCPRCGTALSSHELAQGYKETTDNSVYIKFKLKKGQKIGNFTTDDNTYILSWTTTPWTLPGNVALAVREDIEYDTASFSRSDRTKENFIFATDLHDKVRNQLFGNPPVGVAPILEFKTFVQIDGGDLVGLEYEPLFPIKSLESKTAFKIYPADFVTTEDGTGVVHTAVMYGEDDYQLGVKVGLPQHHTVNEEGKFLSEVPGGLGGMYVKAKETEEKILKYLEAHRNLLRTEAYTHEYPYCWRCGTPLLYYARDSWFIAMSTLRKEMLKNNEKINWIPEHVKEGRFGEWLREAKDWNLSRERYWGTPLPIWECAHCAHREIVGSLDGLSECAGAAKNTYRVMRHGEAESNISRTIDSGQKQFHLTVMGRNEARKNLEKLKQGLARKKEKIDLIVASDILRTKETAVIAEEILGVPIEFDKRLEEIHLGPTLSGCHDSKYHVLFPSYESRFEIIPEGGESLRDLRTRMWSVLEELETKHHGKNILIVSHEYPIWMLTHAAEGWSEKRAIREKHARDDEDFIHTGEIRNLEVKRIPRNKTGEADLHRPFVDEITFACPKCKKEMKRVKEVIDVWYDSGAMPYGELHYPFENKELIEKHIFYPADYISEGMDQTRGWFYTLLAIATALGYPAPYKNVISLGLINDKTGQKMSKSKGNIVDPWVTIQKYGVDAVRWYFYATMPPGESKNFDEAEILKAFRRFHLIIWNSLVFYRTYADKTATSAASKHLLDRWILARLHETVEKVGARLDAYDIREAALALEMFTDDLSRWYIRRSRRRLQKPLSASDYAAASGTLRHVLLEFSKMLAPFTPFFAEALYAALGDGESVHFESWLATDKKLIDGKLLAAMSETRDLASAVLAKRAALSIKVRQPLATLTVKSPTLKNEKEILEILKDEVNVKSVAFDPKLKEAFALDTTITPELKEEGRVREFVRIVQDLRQKGNLTPQQGTTIFLVSADASALVQNNEQTIKKEVNASGIEYRSSEKFDVEIRTKFEGEDIHIQLLAKKIKR